MFAEILNLKLCRAALKSFHLNPFLFLEYDRTNRHPFREKWELLWLGFSCGKRHVAFHFNAEVDFFRVQSWLCHQKLPLNVGISGQKVRVRSSIWQPPLSALRESWALQCLWATWPDFTDRSVQHLPVHLLVFRCVYFVCPTYKWKVVGLNVTSLLAWNCEINAMHHKKLPLGQLNWLVIWLACFEGDRQNIPNVVYWLFPRWPFEIYPMDM